MGKLLHDCPVIGIQRKPRAQACAQPAAECRRGEPVKKAMDLIYKIVSANPNVLSRRGIDVLFQEFAKDALVLRVLYWIDKTNPLSANKVPSELRLAIYEAIQNEGILLATTQKDPHLDAAPSVK